MSRECVMNERRRLADRIHTRTRELCRLEGQVKEDVADLAKKWQLFLRAHELEVPGDPEDADDCNCDLCLTIGWMNDAVLILKDTACLP